jgi:uncharacterized protein DUF1707
VSEDDNRQALVLVRDRREAVIQILADSFANDLLDVDAFEERTARAHQATALAALDALVADLAPLPAGATHAPLVKIEADAARERPERRTALALFGAVERRGGWVVPKQLKSLSIFGASVLDFREASFAPGVTEVRVKVVFGALEIIVPPNLTVECEGTGVFGTFEHAGGGVADPDRPVLRIVGTAVFGSVEVEVRLPGESGRDARRRRRRESKALRAAERAEPRMLPPRR